MSKLSILLCALVVAPAIVAPVAAAAGACAGPMYFPYVARKCVDVQVGSATFCQGGNDPYWPTPSCDRVAVGGAHDAEVTLGSGLTGTKRTTTVDAGPGTLDVASEGDIPYALLLVYYGLHGERDVGLHVDALAPRVHVSTTGHNSNAPFLFAVEASPDDVHASSYGCLKGFVFGIPYGLECGDWLHDPRVATTPGVSAKPALDLVWTTLP